MRDPVPPTHRRRGLAVVPGTVATCAGLTGVTVLLALYPEETRLVPCLRAVYFGVLWACFRTLRRRHQLSELLPARLVEIGFLWLTAGFTAAAGLRLARTELRADLVEPALASLEQGAVFLLGTTLISYGIVLLLADLVDSRQRLAARVAVTSGALVHAEQARARLEARVVEAEAMRTVGELAAGLAHDLRNPLAVAKATLDALRARPRPAAEVDEHHRVIARNLERVEKTVTGLLEVGRPGRSRPAPVDLGVLAREAVETVAGEAARREIEVTVCPLLPGRWHTDAELVLRALRNLLANAVEASPAGSPVRLRLRIRRSAAASSLALAVEDRGSGLPAQRERLFTPFFTTKPDGTGLGLLSVARVADRLGGSVRLYPRLRGGTRAVLLLAAAGVHTPRRQPALAEATAP